MNRVALVTGGARGIGVGICASLVEKSYDLIISGTAPQSSRKQVLESLRAPGQRILYVQSDISDGGDRHRIVEEARQEMGSLHVLVNNAGVAPTQRLDLLDASPESFDRVLGINLRGTHFLTQLAARWMIDQKQADPGFQGCVINIGSVSSTMVSPNRAEYCISKAGLSMSTQAWAARLAEFDLAVFEIRPGIIRSDMTDAVREKYDALIRSGGIPQARWGLPADVGRAVASLAEGDFPYSTGSVLHVDGGLSIHRL